MFAEDLAGRIFPFESEAARVFSRIASHRRALSKPITHADRGHCPSTREQTRTRNVEDFEDRDLEIVDPWNGS
jgi:toxin FitB